MAAAMFKKFTERDNVSGSTQLKSSVQKQIRHQLIESYPAISDYMDQILPKKENFKLIKCHDHIELLAGPTGDLLFFKSRDGPFIPTLRLMHQYPFIVPWQQVDKGAIKFIMKGSNVMCPGLTSAGGRLNPLELDSIIVIMAEGKDHAMAVGRMVMSHQDIKKTNAGIGIENIHYLNDGLWTMKAVK